MKTKADTPAKTGSVLLREESHGDWHVTIHSAPGGKRKNFRPVRIKYKKRTVFTGHGDVAYMSACDLAKHLDDRKYIPRLDLPKVNADMTEAQRRKSADENRSFGVPPGVQQAAQNAQNAGGGAFNNQKPEESRLI